MTKQIIGYTHFKLDQPVYKTEPGQVSTRAVVMCAWCRKMIDGSGGPKTNTVCNECTIKELGKVADICCQINDLLRVRVTAKNETIEKLEKELARREEQVKDLRFELESTF